MSDRHAIEYARAEFLDAFNSGNVDGMMAILSEDYVGMAPNRPRQKGKAAARALWEEGFATARSRFTVVLEEIAIIGDLAIDQFCWTADSTPRGGGTPTHDEGKGIWIWQRQRDATWKIARAIWNSDLAPAGSLAGAVAVP